MDGEYSWIMMVLIITNQRVYDFVWLIIIIAIQGQALNVLVCLFLLISNRVYGVRSKILQNFETVDTEKMGEKWVDFELRRKNSTSVSTSDSSDKSEKNYQYLPSAELSYI